MSLLGKLAFIGWGNLIVPMAPYLILHNHLTSEENLAVNVFLNILLLLENFGLLAKTIDFINLHI